MEAPTSDIDWALTDGLTCPKCHTTVNTLFRKNKESIGVCEFCFKKECLNGTSKNQ